MMNYAKTAKKLDVKRLKNTMWDIISEGAGHNAAGMEEVEGDGLRTLQPLVEGVGVHDLPSLPTERWRCQR